MQTVSQRHVVFQKHKYVLFSSNSVYWNIHLEKYLLSHKYTHFSLLTVENVCTLNA